MRSGSRTRKFTSLFFAFCILLSSLCLSSSAHETTVFPGKTEYLQAAVYANSKYTIEMNGGSFVADHVDDGKMLTDRKYSKSYYGSGSVSEGWVKIKGPGKAFNISVITDFGFEANDVFNFYTRVFQCKAKSELFPKKVSYYVSADGKSYTFVGDGTTLTNTANDKTTAIFSFVAEKGFKARYVKTVFSCYSGSTLCINEVAATAKGNCFDANNGSNAVFKDSQGLTYKISGNKAEVIQYTDVQTEFSGVVSPSEDSFNKDGSVYYLGEELGNKVKVTTDFIGIGQPNFSNAPNNIQYIVIHNTATTHESTTAERYNQRLHTTTDTSSWHYTVDENEIYHSLADSIVGWHAGPTHNYESIGIEICVNGAPTDYKDNPIFEGYDYENWVENRFKKSLKNSAVLVAELLTRYGLGLDRVIQHYDVTLKDCPLWMRYKDGKIVYDGDLWVYFMNYVEEYYYLLNGDNPTQAVFKTADIIIPDYIETQDGKVYPVTSIAANVFAERNGVFKSVTLGNLINNITKGCFDGTKDINVIVPSKNSYFKSDKNGKVVALDGSVVFDPNPVLKKPNPSDECTLKIIEVDGNYYVISKGTKFTLGILSNQYGKKIIEAFDFNGNTIKSGTQFGTGATIIFEDGAKLYTVLKGDLDGNVKIDAEDYILTKKAFFGTTHTLKRQYLAAAITNGTNVTADDYIILKRHFFGMTDIRNHIK